VHYGAWEMGFWELCYFLHFDGFSRVSSRHQWVFSGSIKLSGFLFSRNHSRMCRDCFVLMHRYGKALLVLFALDFLSILETSLRGYLSTCFSRFRPKLFRPFFSLGPIFVFPYILAPLKVTSELFSAYPVGLSDYQWYSVRASNSLYQVPRGC
jgi:hypothetical protein